MVRILSASSAFYNDALGSESGDGMSYSSDSLTQEEQEQRERYEAYRQECVARRLAATGKFVRPTIGKRNNK